MCSPRKTVLEERRNERLLKRKERRVKNNGESQTPANTADTDMKMFQSPLSTQASHPDPRKIDAMPQILAMLTPRRKRIITASIALGEAVRVSATALAWTRIPAHRLRIFPGRLSMSIWPLLGFHLHAKANCLIGHRSTTKMGLTLPKNTNMENGEASVFGKCFSILFSFFFSLSFSSFSPRFRTDSLQLHISSRFCSHIFSMYHHFPPLLPVVFPG